MITEFHIAKYTCKNIFQDPALQVPKKGQQSKFLLRSSTLECCLSCIHSIQNSFYLYIKLFDKTDIQAVQSSIKIYLSYVKVHSTFDRKELLAADLNFHVWTPPDLPLDEGQPLLVCVECTLSS